MNATATVLEEESGLNFVPRQMSREELRQTYWNLVQRLYTPEALLKRYFKPHWHFYKFHSRGDLRPAEDVP